MVKLSRNLQISKTIIMFRVETDMDTDALKEKLQNCLNQQMSEYELLKSMYADPGEIVLSDPKVLDEIHIYLSGSQSSSDYTPAHLDFVINLSVEELKLEVFINLPSLYPEEEPDVCVRCNQLNRLQESELNSELSTFLRENREGEVCLYTIVSWLQENAGSFTALDAPAAATCENKQPVQDNFIRHWIYSHHIYNKKKREDIVCKAKDLNITGFCLAGKPGIICIEGLDSNCKQWWRQIKSMNWKKIVIRKTDIFDLAEETKERKFNKFEELNFNNSTTRSKQFAKFMAEIGLMKDFNDFFGLCSDHLL